MPSKNPLLHWVHGFLAAFIGGGANAITSYLVAPETFNFTDKAGITKLVTLVTVSAVIAGAAYLKQSPLPYYDFEGGDVKTKREAVVPEQKVP
jgi:hypothetical protein